MSPYDREHQLGEAFAAELPPDLSDEAIRARWISRAASLLPPSVADDEPSADWSRAHRQIAQRMRALMYPLQMPLANPIHSDSVQPPFFQGPGTSVMARCFVSDDSRIGAYTYIGFGCMVTRATIGNYVSIANNCTIGPGEHELDAISTSSIFYPDAWEKLTEKPCTIGPDAWIAEGSIIRRGVTVGIGAVVGANSFVNADVPPFAIVAGSPARLIRMRFSQQMVDAILESQWWTLKVDAARAKLRELEELRKSLGE